MSDIKPLTDDEIKKLVKDLIKTFLPISGKLTGEKPEPSIFNYKDTIEFAKSLMEFAYVHSKNEELLKNTVLPEDVKLKKQIELVDESFQFFSQLIFGKNVDNPVSEFLNMMNPENSYNSIPEAFRVKIRTSIHQIIIEIAKKGRFAQINEFIKTMSTEDVFAHSQSAFRVNKKIKYLLKPRKRLTGAIVEHYLEDYREISGFIEPIIVILYGLKQILDEKLKTFSNIREISIGNLVNQLKKDPMFNVLVETYNPGIRNSIMHASYHVDPLLQTIEFVDKGKKFSLSYREFVDYVQEILMRTIILSYIEREVGYLVIKNYLERRNQILYNQNTNAK